MTGNKSSAASDWVDTDGVADLSTPDWVAELEFCARPLGPSPGRGRKSLDDRPTRRRSRRGLPPSGADWQTRINAVLRDWLDHH